MNNREDLIEALYRHGLLKKSGNERVDSLRKSALFHEGSKDSDGSSTGKIPEVQAPKPEPDIDQESLKEIEKLLTVEMEKDPTIKQELIKLNKNVKSFKAKVEEILITANVGKIPPTLSDSGYEKLAKNMFGVTFESNNKDLKPEKEDKTKTDKAEKEGDKQEGAEGTDDMGLGDLEKLLGQ